jgi:arabinofuranosyltransferase
MNNPRRATMFHFLAVVTIAYAALQGVRLSWVTDDAYISFRYAQNLLAGKGLVFNLGERVEGYSNFLWTLWCALGMRLGFEPESWSTAWGILSYLATLGLLCRFTYIRTGRSALIALPVAAMAGALHHDWSIFASSGLETSAFTFLAVAGYYLLVRRDDPRCLMGAGLIFALTALTRADGLLFGILGGLFVIATGKPRGRALLAYGVPLAGIVIPYVVWKISYYGDLFPNTYYAKSIHLDWYSQGWIYLKLYFQKYWVLLVGLTLAASALLRPGADERALDVDDSPRRLWRRATLLAALFAVGYSWHVARVGGDFMYARLLIPATPFYLLLLELGLEAWLSRPLLWLTASAGALIGIGASPYPFSGQGWIHGIIHEREFYPPERMQRTREFGKRLHHYFQGLPIRMAFTGGQAVLAYHSQAPVAIETATGLTDSLIAHQPITRRGRVGHEKKTPFLYLITDRKAHLWMYSSGLLADSLAAYIPVVRLRLDTLTVAVLHWDPPVMRELERRGAVVENFLGTLDLYIRHMAASPDAEVRTVYEKTKRFYFDFFPDSAREGAFQTRLGMPPIAGAEPGPK